MEIAKTILKVLVIAFVYLGIGPLLGYYLKGKDTARRITLGFTAWWLVRPPSDFTLMLYSIEEYRGHCRGRTSASHRDELRFLLNEVAGVHAAIGPGGLRHFTSNFTCRRFFGFGKVS